MTCPRTSASVKPCAFSCAWYFVSLPAKYCFLIWSSRVWTALSVIVIPSFVRLGRELRLLRRGT